MTFEADQATIGLKTEAPKAPGLLKRSMDIGGLSLEDLQRRLFQVCIIVATGAAAYGLVDILAAAWAGAPNPEDPILMGICTLISIAVAIVARKKGIRRTTLMDLAFSYEFVVCVIISLAESMNSGFKGYTIWGISWVCVPLVAFPAILPYRRIPMVLAAVLSALTGPVIYLIATPLQGRALSFSDALNMYIPNFITLGFAISIILYITIWADKLEKARQMGSYRLVGRIGLGGMGEVWQAEHETLARPAAIKLIRNTQQGQKIQSQVAEERFYREAQTTATLTSAHTVTVFDYGTTRDGDQYYVMELLEGTNLQDLVSKFGPMPPSRVIHLLTQICYSLGEAHKAGLIHRDIKPANLFVCQKGEEYDFIKVLDFGLVKPEFDKTTQLTKQSMLLGTPAYASPESARGIECDQRSDIYSLGCVAYFLLSQDLVFPAESPIDMIHMHSQKTPAPIAERATNATHSGLNDLIMRCLEKDPALRPQDCGEILAALEGFSTENSWTRLVARSWWEENLSSHLNINDPAT